MQVSPCLTPRVVNGRHGIIHVPCGHCSACLASKGFARKQRLDVALTDYPLQYFVTLTYNNANLPLAVSEDGDNYYSKDVDYKGNPYSVTLSQLDDDLDTYKYVEMCVSKYGGIPVLSHSDLIKFKKRLRYYIKPVYNNAPLFIYSCGEYGATTYRPHFHLILGFQSFVSIRDVRSVVSEAWSYYSESATGKTRILRGLIDVQQVISGSRPTSYVTQYLNCHTDLPAVLRGQFRQFFSSSCCSAALVREIDFDLRDYFYSPSATVRRLSSVDKSLSYVPLPAFVQNTLWPRPKAIALLSLQDRVRVFSYISTFKFFSDFSASVLYGNLDRFLEVFFYHILFDGYTLTTEACELILYKYWLAHKHISDVVIKLDVNLYTYFEQYDLYYSRVELYKLGEFYRLQEQLSKHCSLPQLYALYYDTDHFPSSADPYLTYAPISSIKEYCQFRDITKKIVLDTTKTKKRNDYFISKGLKRKPFIFNIHPKFKLL